MMLKAVVQGPPQTNRVREGRRRRGAVHRCKPRIEPKSPVVVAYRFASSGKSVVALTVLEELRQRLANTPGRPQTEGPG
jgi:hypothetical protein